MGRQLQRTVDEAAKKHKVTDYRIRMAVCKWLSGEQKLSAICTSYDVREDTICAFLTKIITD